MQDVYSHLPPRFFRPTLYKQAQLGAANSSVVFIAASMNRWGLLFFNVGNNSCVWWNKDDGVDLVSGAAQPGVLVGQSSGLTLLTEDLHGDMVHKSWACVSTTATLNVAWLEIMHPILPERNIGKLQQSPY